MASADRFVPIRRLGGGEYCEVHLARDTARHDNEVVVKWFRLKHRKVERKIRKGKLNFASDLRAAFLDEIALTARFDHPNIVRVLEQGGLDGAPEADRTAAPTRSTAPTDDAPWFAMPHYPTDLARELWGRAVPKPLGAAQSPERVRTLLKQIMAGLKEIHAQGIVHRDIKPQNILSDADGNAVICDFGHALNPAATAPLGKNRYGTAPFVAPEQHAEPDAVDGRADIFSLGVLGYLLLTGQRPNPVLHMPKPAHEINSTLPRDLGDWIQAAMALDPAGRPAGL